ncbi:condensation domain-containing protein [Steroidobacter agaridevorans]|uniref:condensation domain-containing protein n=1 Tax=Steroidobacter agaridevorans TaxID=2695856 RepID=UPI0028055F4C|nr:condensation domain-containing protein [Steroidobacter agaridevorans]
MQCMEPLQTNAPIQPRPLGCTIPLTPAQMSMWVGMLNSGARFSQLRAAATSVRILGPLDVSVFHGCIEALVLRHESLRTRVLVERGVPRQVVSDGYENQFEFVDISRASPTSNENEAASFAQSFIDADIDLSKGPLFEAKLIRLSAHEHVLVLGLDHMVGDGTSYAILSNEVWALYKKEMGHDALSLPALPVQFGDYAVWLQRTQGAWLEQCAAYWKERLSGIPPGCFTGLQASNGVKAPVREMLRFPLGNALTGMLREIAHKSRTLLSSVVLAVYVATLARWCNQEDVLVSFASHGRTGHAALAGMIGSLAHGIYLRVRVTGQHTFLDLILDVCFEIRNAIQHRDHGRVSQLISSSVADASYNWVSAAWASGEQKKGTTGQVGSMEAPLQLRPFPLQQRALRSEGGPKLLVAPCDNGDEIVVFVWHRADILEYSVVARFCLFFRHVASQLSQNPLSSLNSKGLSYEPLG